MTEYWKRRWRGGHEHSKPREEHVQTQKRWEAERRQQWVKEDESRAGSQGRRWQEPLTDCSNGGHNTPCQFQPQLYRRCCFTLLGR